MEPNSPRPPQISKPVMETVGLILRKTRESRSITIDQVNKKTRIASDVLRALEDGKCDEMMSYTYVKSFLKKYCDFLGLDPVEVISEYSVVRQEKAIEKPAPSAGADKVPEIRKPATKTSPKQHTFEFPDKEAEKPLPIAEEAPKPKPQPEAQPKPEVVTAPRIPSPAAADTGSQDIIKYLYIAAGAIIAIVLIIGLAGLAGKAYKALRQGRQEKIVYTIAPKKPIARQAAIAATAPKSQAAKSGMVRLTIKTKRSVLVRVKTDGTLRMERVLPKGSRESFKAKERISLYAAKGEAIEVILNGKSVGSPGKGVKNLEFTAKGMRSR